MDKDTIAIEVAYALPNKQAVIPLRVVQGCSVFEAAQQSGMNKLFPDLVLDDATLGIFGKLVTNPHEYVVKQGDRVEIYRPLILDLREVRKQRAAKAKEAKRLEKVRRGE